MLAQNVASAVAAWALDPEEEAIISQIKAAAAVAGLGVNDQFDIDKFTADKLTPLPLPPRVPAICSPSCVMLAKCLLRIG